MNAAPNFGSVLDKPASDFTRPPPVPVGLYSAILVGLPRRDKSSKKQTEYVEFQVKLTAAGEDVSAEDLAAIGGIPDYTMRLTFYVTDKSGYRLREFLEDDLGIEIGENSLWEASQETAGMPLKVSIRHTPSSDGKGVYAEIGSTLPAE